ncbi:MAG: Nif3-like dinuclear metal center hexameric protein [Clostridiales bacterium]|nr:Nif3-like dinuclear metal center hexameric protein [Clostridiales bacterium]
MDKKSRVSVKEVAEIINELIPNSTQEEWDNSGLIIGFEDREVKRIITCLDINAAVLEEALGKKVDMIVSHHPLIFDDIKSISDGDSAGKMIMSLIAGGISVYSSHTPFDKIKGGNNDVIAKNIGLTSVKTMGEAELCRKGKLKKHLSFAQTIEAVAQGLEMSLRSIRTVGALDKEIGMVGVCSGSGAEFMELAKENGCDLLITGDVKYHQAMAAEELGICVIDAGHYHTEKFFGAAMKEKLEKRLEDDVEIIVSEKGRDPFEAL